MLNFSKLYLCILQCYRKHIGDISFNLSIELIACLANDEFIFRMNAYEQMVNLLDCVNMES